MAAEKAKCNGFGRVAARVAARSAALALVALLAPPSAAGATPAEQATPAYVRNDVCLECHAKQGKQWAASHHFAAMARATEDTVLGDFADAAFEHKGVTSSFFRRDGKFFVRTQGADGKLRDFAIAYTFGVDPLQQYLIELERGRVQCLTIAWDTQRKRWFSLYPDETIPAGDVLHWTGRYQNWNSMCASCHTTDLKRNYDAASDSYATTWAELNVSCQSCHGPGEKHVAWAKSGTAGADDGLVVDFGAASAARATEICAPCHARRSELDATPTVGAPLYDDYLPALLTAGLYHPDGQQKDEVYVYGSYLQSKMYEAGVGCTDCHDPHTAKLRAEGNSLCVRCHQLEGDTERFPTLKTKDYETRAHHFHEPDAAGSSCVECHMPESNYMIVDPRRDHAIRVPRPDLSVKLGTPNPCTKCHVGRTAEWAAEAIARWLPSSKPAPHYGEVLAAGRAGTEGAETGLAALAADAAQPAIVRASALDLLAGYGARSLPASITATRDGDPGVRTAAVASLERIAPAQRLPLLAALLADPTLAVRIETARALSSAPRESFDATQREAYETARQEFIAVQNANLEAPGSHLNLAVLHANEGDAKLAEDYYRRALVLDPDFTPARLNLAHLLDGQGRTTDVVKVLEEGIARIPGQGELHYSLGLALAQEKRFDDAARELREAAKLLPERPRVFYNFALVAQHVGRPDEAEAALTKARELDPADPEILYALTLLYAQQGKWTPALATGEKLAEMMPGNAGVEALLKDLRARSAASNGGPTGREAPAPQ